VSFRLCKWYLDCVTSDGEALIFYVAELRWSELAIRYTSAMHHRAERTRVATSLRGYQAPAIDGDVVAWRSAPLRIEGTWRALVPAISENILASEQGRVEWRCLQPAALVTLRVGRPPRQRTIEGLGYVEHVALTVRPWRMPIDELQWGRFVAPVDASGAHDAIAWIDWRGDHSARLVFRDGRPVDAREIGPRGLVLGDGGVLSLDAGRTLREGAIGSTVLTAVPPLVNALPARMLGVRERKWCSRATFTPMSRSASHGWAIHEVVQWP
jgi:hypothetical protein